MTVARVEGWTEGPLRDRAGKVHFEEPIAGSEVLVIDVCPGEALGHKHVYVRVTPNGRVETSEGDWPPDVGQTVPAHFYK
jgi:hypothetical protein